MKELDAILSAFVDARLTSLSNAELQEYENLLAIESPELLLWLLGHCEPAAEWQNSGVLRDVQGFAQAKHP